MNNHQDKVPVTLPAETNKKPYEMPDIQVIELANQTSLLIVSGGVGASRSDYGNAIEDEW